MDLYTSAWRLNLKNLNILAQAIILESLPQDVPLKLMLWEVCPLQSNRCITSTQLYFHQAFPEKTLSHIAPKYRIVIVIGPVELHLSGERRLSVLMATKKGICFHAAQINTSN